MNDLIAALSAAVALRSLLTYQRKGKDYNLMLHVIAWALMVFMFYIIVLVLVFGSSVHIMGTLFLILLAILMYKFNGNIMKAYEYLRGFV